MGLVKQAAKIGQDYYPEIMGRTIVVNAPRLFSGVWSVCKGYVDEKTRKKISIISSSKSLEELLKHIDMDQIPEFLGGTNKATFMDNPGPW